MRGECPEPNKAGCPYPERRGGCFSDTDHLYPKHLAHTALELAFVELDINKKQKCRWEHENKREPTRLPYEEFMMNAVELGDTDA